MTAWRNEVISRQAEAGRIDEPHQVEGQARVLLEDFLDLVGAGLLPHEVDEVEDVGLRRRQELGLDHRGAREPEALEELHAHAGRHVVLLGGLHLLGDELGARMAARVLDEHGQLVGRQQREVELDVVGQRQPGGVGGFQHRVVEGQVEAALAQRLQDRQAGSDLGGGRMAERRDLQHHLVWVHQFEVATRQAFMSAVDEDELLAHQLFGACVRQGREDEEDVGGRGVRHACARTVEQLVADHGVLAVDDRLPGDHGARRGAAGPWGVDGGWVGMHAGCVDESRPAACGAGWIIVENSPCPRLFLVIRTAARAIPLR